MEPKGYRVAAVVDRPRADRALLGLGQIVDQKVTGNVNFNPAPAALADLHAALPIFATALQNAATQKGMAGALTAARIAVSDALDHLADQITAGARKQPPEVGAAMIESAGLKVKKVAVRIKLPLAAGYGTVSGTALLVARAVAKVAMYFWQVSTDGVHWTDCPSSNTKSATTITGLTPCTLYYFRFRAQTRKGMGDWSASVSLIAH